MKASSEVKLAPQICWYAEISRQAQPWVHWVRRVKRLRQVQGWARKGGWIKDWRWWSSQRPEDVSKGWNRWGGRGETSIWWIRSSAQC